MDRIINNELQPLNLENGVLLPAAGTPEAGPKEVELSELDRQRYVETGRITVLKLAAAEQTTSAPASPSQPTPSKSTTKERN
jgi:hypothetical protein